VRVGRRRVGVKPRSMSGVMNPFPVHSGEGRGPVRRRRRLGFRIRSAYPITSVLHLDPGLRRGARWL